MNDILVSQVPNANAHHKAYLYMQFSGRSTDKGSGGCLGSPPLHLTCCQITPTTAVAFRKRSRLNFVNATRLTRKTILYTTSLCSMPVTESSQKNDLQYTAITLWADTVCTAAKSINCLAYVIKRPMSLDMHRRA